jgi:hypothetical protein
MLLIVHAINPDDLNSILQDHHGGSRRQTPECCGMPSYTHTHTHTHTTFWGKATHRSVVISNVNIWLRDSTSLGFTPAHLVSVIWNIWYPAIKEASFERLCFPEPPTPTSNAFPQEVRMIREICVWKRSVYRKNGCKCLYIHSYTYGSKVWPRVSRLHQTLSL